MLVAALGSVGGSGWAQRASEQAAAQALFDEGKTLRDEGAIEQACAKFAESLRLDPTVGTRFNLADCYERTGRIASAWTSFLEVAAATELAGQSERAAAARGRANALAPRLPKLRITAAARVAGLTIRIDGTELREAAWSTDMPIDLGTHEIEARAPGHEPWRGQVVAKTEGASVTVEVPPLAEATGSPSGAEGSGQGGGSMSAETGSDVAASSGVGTAGLVLGGVGLAGVVVGTVFGLVAMSRKSRVDELCPDYDNCTAEGIDINDEAKLYGNVSTVGFVAGGALFVAGLVMWLAAPAAGDSSASTASMTTTVLWPTCSTTEAGLTLRTRW